MSVVICDPLNVFDAGANFDQWYSNLGYHGVPVGCLTQCWMIWGSHMFEKSSYIWLNYNNNDHKIKPFWDSCPYSLIFLQLLVITQILCM